MRAAAKYISVSDMRFSAKVQKCKSAALNKTILTCFIFVCSAALLLYCSRGSAEVIDRIVAYVDNIAITLSDLQEEYAKTKKTTGTLTEEDVLNSMINRALLIKKAKEIRLESQSPEELLKEYIEIKIRAAIHIKEEDIARFYAEHIKEFEGKEYLSVRDEIENYLFELETNRQLKRHLEELRANAEIKIQLKEED